MEQLNLQELIKEISPLYNTYKKSSRSINGTDALCIMWEIGDILNKVVTQLDIAPHNLYREIYGKSEGKNNITQKSYITREFLGRSYRIRHIFNSKKIIKEELYNLKKFTLFREAMPFFDNEKFILKGTERNQLVKLLNSDQTNNSIFKKLKLLQKEKIGINNPRNQKLNEVESKKEIFITFYNYLFNLIKENSFSEIKNIIKSYDYSIISKISINTGALTQEGLMFVEIPEKDFDKNWVFYIKMLRDFSLENDAKNRRRFRRLIPSERIVKLAEMLNAITSKDELERYKK